MRNYLKESPIKLIHFSLIILENTRAKNNKRTWIRNIDQERLAEIEFSTMNQVNVVNMVINPANKDQEQIIEAYFVTLLI